MLKSKLPQETFFGSYLYDRIVPVDHLLRNIQGDDALDRARVFLADLGSINFPADRREWQTIRQYEKLRHYIVHRGGKVPKDDGDTWRFTLRRGPIRGDGSVNDDVILLSSDSCEGLLKDIEGFFIILHRELKQVLDAQKPDKQV